LAAELRGARQVTHRGDEADRIDWLAEMSRETGGQRPFSIHGARERGQGDARDFTADSGIVWARADRPSRMLVEVDTTPRFKHARTLRGPILTPDHDLAGKVLVDDLPASQEIFYRVTLEDLYGHAVRSERTTLADVMGPEGERP